MNEREPDWAHVARSQGKVLAVTAALWLAFTAADRTLWLFVDTGHERMAQVYGTAARLANPDKRLGGHLDRRGLLETTYRLWGEPRRAGPSVGGTEYTIVEDAFGRVRAPGLGGPSGRLSDAIDSVDTESSPKVPAAGVQKVIDGLPQTLHAVAVVDFTESMTSDRLAAFNRRHGICGGADVSYIYATSYYDDSDVPALSNAIVWNRAMTGDGGGADVEYRCATEPESALLEYRERVALLAEGDDLGDFGLTPGWLEWAAQEGLVHGLVLDRWKIGDLRKLLDDPDVQTVHLADVAFDLGPE